MGMAKVKAFIIDDEEVADLTHMHESGGEMRVAISCGVDLSPADARKLAKWLLRAADACTAHNRCLAARKREGK